MDNYWVILAGIIVSETGSPEKMLAEYTRLVLQAHPADRLRYSMASTEDGWHEDCSGLAYRGDLVDNTTGDGWWKSAGWPVGGVKW